MDRLIGTLSTAIGPIQGGRWIRILGLVLNKQMPFQGMDHAYWSFLLGRNDTPTKSIKQLVLDSEAQGVVISNTVLGFREELAFDLAIYLDGTADRSRPLLDALERLFFTLVMQVYEALREDDEVPSHKLQLVQHVHVPFHASFSTLAGAILDGAMCIAGLPSTRF